MFTRANRSYTCEVVTLHGDTENGASTIDVAPEYNECSTNLGGPMTVTNTGCFYRLHLGADEAEGGHTWTSTTGLHCEEGKHIIVHVYPNTSQHAEKPTEPACQYTYTDQQEGEPTKLNQSLVTIELTNESSGPRGRERSRPRSAAEGLDEPRCVRPDLARAQDCDRAFAGTSSPGGRKTSRLRP